MALRAQLETLVNESNEIRAKAERLKKLKPTQLGWTPSSDRWSIARILDHLNKTHALTIPKFEAALASAAEAGDEHGQEIKPGFKDRVFLKIMSPTPPFPLPVPPMFEPDATVNTGKIVAQFLALHDGLIRVMTKSDAHRLRKLVVTSPVSARVKVNFLTYLQANLQHEQYHFTQIESLLTDPSFPKS